MKAILKLSSLMFLFYSAQLYAQVLPDSSQLNTLDNFWKNNKGWYLKWNGYTGTPASMFGLKTKSFGITPHIAALNFIKEYQGLFEKKTKTNSKNLKASKPTLKIKSNREKNDTYYLEVQQEYKEIPILGAIFTIGVTSQGEIFFSMEHIILMKLI